jgi:general secretion pathway protein L
MDRAVSPVRCADEAGGRNELTTLTDNNQWTVLGYDLRSLARHWTGAWRDVLFTPDSPLRRRLDEPVCLHLEDGQRVVYQGGNATSLAPQENTCEALALPESLYLARELHIPLAAETELDTVLAMEVAANSPFAADDTVSGWREIGRDGQGISIALVVAARSGVAQWLGASAGPSRRDTGPRELWARHNGHWVTLQGFGETERDRRYRRRLLRVLLKLSLLLAALFAIAGLVALQQGLALQRIDTLQRQVQARAAAAVDMRESLLRANEYIVAANHLAEDYPNPHVEVARLTELLDDDAYLAHFSMRGRDMRIRGRAQDAAQVMQGLAAQSGYASVTAPQPFTAVGNTGQEQFYLDVEIAEASAAAAGAESADGDRP